MLDAAPGKAFPQQEFDLCIHAAQIAGGKTLQFLPQRGVYP